MQQSELKARLKSGKTGGVFLLCGAEEYLKRYYISQFRSSILTDEAFNAWNHQCFEGPDPDFGLLLDAVISPPMMAEKKLIEWDGADFSAMKESALDRFASLAATVREYPGVTLLFRVNADALDPGTAKRPSALWKRLSEVAETLHFEASGDAQLTSWINTHLAHEGLSPSGGAIRQMLDQCGHSMDILASEIEKLTDYCRAHRTHTVSPEMIRLVCTSTAEDDAFGLTNAMLAGDIRGAYRKLDDLKRRRVEPMLILAQLGRFFSDLSSVSLLAAEGAGQSAIASALSMNEYKVGLYLRGIGKRQPAFFLAALSRCREMDLAAKTGVDPLPGLDRLIASFA